MAKKKGTAGGTPRERGEPSAPNKKPPAPPGKGKFSEAFDTTDPRIRYKMRYELREMDELVTSNTDTGGINAAYPKELQPRDRTRAASRDQVSGMARHLEPSAYLAEFSSLDRGAPIIGPDNVVESGNGRTMALRIAQRDNLEGAQKYRDELRQRAAGVGIRPDAVDKMKNPVLVRVRVDEVDRVEFARKANTSAALGMSETEKAQADAGRLGNLESFNTTGENITNDLRRADNRAFVREFVGNLPSTEQASIMDSGGNLTRSGNTRIQAAMLTRVYDDPKLAERVFESQDNDVQSVTNGIMGSLGKVARSEELVRTGQRSKDLSIADDIRGAVKKYVDARERGYTIPDYIAQQGMFGGGPTPTEQKIMIALDERRRSGKRVAEFIGRWADLVENQPDPRQGGMFGGAGAPRESLIDRWLSQDDDTPSGPSLFS